MKRLSWMMLTSVCCTLTAGCSDETTATTDMVDATVAISDFTDTAVESAEMCVRETGVCAVSDATGKLTLAIPAETDLTYTVDAPGMFPVLLASRSAADSGSVGLQLFQTDLVAAAFETADIALDDTKGHLIQGLVGPGSTVTLTPNSGAGALYGDNAIADPEQTAIEDTPNPGWGWGNVDPGDVSVNITPGAGSGCVHPTAWSSSSPTRVDTIVEAGRLTLVATSNCTGE